MYYYMLTSIKYIYLKRYKIFLHLLKEKKNTDMYIDILDLYRSYYICTHTNIHIDKNIFRESLFYINLLSKL